MSRRVASPPGVTTWPRVALIFPWDLHGGKATAIRARVTVEAVRRQAEAAGGPGPELVNPDLGGTGRGPWLPRFTRAALAELRRAQPDVVHAITTQAIVPALLYRRRHPRTRVVFEMHGLTCLELDGLRLRRRVTLALLDTWGARGADGVIAMSYTQRELLRRWLRVPSAAVHVVWGPVDLDLFRATEPPPAPPFVVGYSGNDTSWQGVQTIVDAAQRLAGRADVRFVLMGFPRERVAAAGLSNVTLLDVVDREAVPARLAACHAFLSPRAAGAVSDAQYPFKLSAYLALGRPIVATAVSDQPRIVREADCGLIVEARDGAALAAAVVQLAELPAARRLEMGRNARRFAECHLSPDRLGRILECIYNDRMGGERVG